MTARSLVPLDRATADRLAKVCGMFGSDHDGERASAAAKANQIVRDTGLSWSDILAVRQVADPGTSRRHEVVRDRDWRRTVRFCADRVRMLNEREQNLIAQLSLYRTTPSDRQLNWLADIASRLRGAAC